MFAFLQLSYEEDFVIRIHESHIFVLLKLSIYCDDLHLLKKEEDFLIRIVETLIAVTKQITF